MLMPNIATRSPPSLGYALGYGLCALALMLDGLDNQMLGLVMPALVVDWKVGPSTFGPFIIVTVIAMSTGTACAGWLGDRIGRKPALAGSLAMLGVFTLASSVVTAPWQLFVLRGLAALGMGGAMPNATALLAEYGSTRHRSLAVTFGTAFIPLGGVFAGLVGSQVLPHFGWRVMFTSSGIATIAAAAAVASLLPESPAFEHLHGTRRVGKEADAADGGCATGDPADLRRDTMALWGAFFFCMLGLYSMINWVPMLLAQAGFGLSATSFGLGAFNFGGIIGALVIAAAMDRYGSRVPLAVMALAGGLACLASTTLFSRGASLYVTIMAIAVMGLFIAGLQTALIALAARVYPAAIRSTGIGAALAFGRLGAIASSITGTVVLGLGSDYFLMLMGALVIAAGLSSSIVAERSAERKTVLVD